MAIERAIHLKVAYDGTDYSGWQVQSVAPTVQGRLMKAVSEMEGRPMKVYGAGRTDAGVHARGQGASFTTATTIPARGFMLGLNSILPSDIAVVEANELPAGFQARFAARGKHYRYSLWNSPTKQPLITRFAWHRWKPLDVEAMDRGARHLEGKHDFDAFRAAECGRDNAVRRLWRVAVSRSPDYDEDRGTGLVWIDVEGTAFLWHMVRIIAGTLVEVGRGKWPPGWVAEVLQSRDRRKGGPTAPPHGLCLEHVYYPELDDPPPI